MSEQVTETPTPVGPARIEAALQAIGLEYEVRDHTSDPEKTRIVTGFVDTAVAFVVDGGELRAEGYWRGEVPAARAGSILEVTRTMNERNFVPVLFVTEGSEDGRLAVCARARQTVGQGLTDEQIRDFLVYYLRQTVDTFAKLAQAFPEVVDWEDPHAAHAAAAEADASQAAGQPAGDNEEDAK